MNYLKITKTQKRNLSRNINDWLLLPVCIYAIITSKVGETNEEGTDLYTWIKETQQYNTMPIKIALYFANKKRTINFKLRKLK